MSTAPKDFSYHVPGGRTGVLLIHSLCGSPTEMRFLANGLARQGYTVHVPQLAGHGADEAEIVRSTWHDWYRSAELALNEISKTCDRVVVGGLSTGAVLALLLAANNPDKVNALNLFSPTLWLSGKQIPWYVSLFRIITSKRLANLFNFPAPFAYGIKCPRIRDFLLKASQSGDSPLLQVNTPGGAVFERQRLVNVVRRVLGQIKQPVLILHPREDAYAGLDNAEHLQKSLGGVVDLVVLEDSYHIVTVDRQRDAVLAYTSAFVNRVVSGLSRPLAGANSGAMTEPETYRYGAFSPAAA